MGVCEARGGPQRRPVAYLSAFSSTLVSPLPLFGEAPPASQVVPFGVHEAVVGVADETFKPRFAASDASRETQGQELSLGRSAARLCRCAGELECSAAL